MDAEEIKKLIADALKEQRAPFKLDGPPEKQWNWKKTWLYNWIYQWWGHIVLMTMAVAIFMAYPRFIHLFFPTAGEYDAGVLMKIPFALIGYFIFDFALQYAVKRNWKVIDKYMNPNSPGVDFGDDFSNASPTVRLWITNSQRLLSLLVCSILLLAL